MNIISASEVFLIVKKIRPNNFFCKIYFFLTLNYSCKAAVPPYFGIPERYFRLKSEYGAKWPIVISEG